jgi:hypothetical protein
VTHPENALYGLVEQVFDHMPPHYLPGMEESLLLTDFLACVTAASVGDVQDGWTKDGTSGYAANLAVRAHLRDQDDVYWRAGIHPGSIIWPVVLAVGAEIEADGPMVAAAAHAGYSAMSVLAKMLGPRHARSWHATATSGGFGAAAAAAMLLGLDSDQRFWACSHAVAVAGGVGQALVERSGTTAFHRAAAAVVGIQAARLAAVGLPSSVHALDGESGLLALLGQESSRAPVAEPDAALEATSVRLYPINGLCQAAVELAAKLRRQVGARVVSGLVVEVSDATAAATTGDPGGDWWDLRAGVAAAWTSADPFKLESTPDSATIRDLVEVRIGSVGSGATRVTARGPEVELTEYTESPPGLMLREPGLLNLLERKWARLIGGSERSVEELQDLTAALLSRGPKVHDIVSLLAPL